MSRSRRLGVILGDSGCWRPHPPRLRGKAVAASEEPRGPGRCRAKPLLTQTWIRRRSGRTTGSRSSRAAQFRVVRGADTGTPSTCPTTASAPIARSRVHNYASLDIPAGAVIDFIGVNRPDAWTRSMGFSLHLPRSSRRIANSSLSYSFPTHDGASSRTSAGPLGILVPGNHDRSFILDVEQAARTVPDELQLRRGLVARLVSDPPASPTSATCRPRTPSTSSSKPSRSRGSRRVAAPAKLLSRRAADARPDGRLPIQGARPALAELRPSLPIEPGRPRAGPVYCWRVFRANGAFHSERIVRTTKEDS